MVNGIISERISRPLKRQPTTHSAVYQAVTSQDFETSNDLNHPVLYDYFGLSKIDTGESFADNEHGSELEDTGTIISEADS